MRVILWLAVFAGTVLFDLFYALFNRALAREATLRACLLSGATNVVAALCFVEYAHEPWLISASFVGGAVGTWAAMKIDGGGK